MPYNNLYIGTHTTQCMKRKVIQLARKTLVISLPLKWTQKFKVEKGSEVEVSERREKLIIKTMPEFRSITLRVKPDFGKRELADLYIRGYDEVKLKNITPNILKKIKEEDLLGFEIIEQGKDYVFIKNVANALESEFDVMLRRTFLLLKEMAKTVEEFLEHGGDLEPVLDMEKATNKLTNFCKRVINTEIFNPSENSTHMYAIVRDLEVIGDIFKYLVCDIKGESKASNEVIVFYSQVKEFLDLFYDFFYKKEKKLFHEIKERRKTLVEKGRLLVKKQGVDGIVAHHSLSLIVSIYNLTGPTLTMNLLEVYR